MRTSRARCRGFTLIELLIVMAVIGILIALLMPAIQSARESARRKQCQSNLRQIGIALHNYHDAHTMYPSGWIGVTAEEPSTSGLTGFGWASMILPMVEQDGLYKSLQFGLSISAVENKSAQETALPIFRCPSDDAKAIWEMAQAAAPSNTDLPINLPTANYLGSAGPGGFGTDAKGIFYLNSSVLFEHIYDGASNTIMAGERKSNEEGGFYSTWVGAVPGGENAARILASTGLAPNDSAGGDGFSSEHKGGANILFADGHVQFISNSIDSTLFQSLGTRRGKEAIGQF